MFRHKNRWISIFLVIFSLGGASTFAQPLNSTKAQENQRALPWLSGDISVDNSVGIGTFLSGYAHTPQWVTTLTLSPTVDLPLPSGWPKMIVGANFGASVWWLNSIQTSILDANHRVQFPDIALGLSLPRFLEFSKIGISFSASLPIAIPVSKSSLALGRIMALGVGLGTKWHKGQFSVGYTPSFRTWIYSGTSKSVDCDDNNSSPAIMGIANPSNPDFAVDQHMLSLVAFRDEESLDGQKCRIVGRQNLLTLKNSVSASWALRPHRVSIGLSYYWNFLRPLEDRPELASVHSSSQSYTQAVLGKIAYTYKLPLPVHTSISTGIVSYQGIYSKTGSMLFPFFDFATPNKNQTQVFIEMVASI